MPVKGTGKRYKRWAEALLAEAVALSERTDSELMSDVQLTRRTLAGLIRKGPMRVVGDAAYEILGSDDHVVVDGETISLETEPWAPSKILHFKAELRSFLRELMSRVGVSGRVPEVTLNRLQFGATPVGKAVMLTVDGSARDVLLFQILNLLNIVGVEHILRCECGKAFAKIGRREFCSPRCQKRYYMRGKRAEERKAKQHGKTTRTRRR